MSRLKHKRGRKSNYTKVFVNSEMHKKARAKALARENYKCKICNSTKELELHHISYHVKGMELENNNLSWVVILCSKCHQKVHNEPFHKYNPKNPLKIKI